MKAPSGPPRDTPWGRADHAERLADGIWFLSTPSHGGFWLDADRTAKVPAEWRALTFNGRQGERGFFEEDCDWAMVALTFPDLFEGQRVDARRTFDVQFAPKLAMEGTPT